VTVTRVEVSEDLRHCKVFVSVIGDRIRRASLDALQHASRFLRGELGTRSSLALHSQLIFVEDRSAERAIELAKTLRDAAQVGRRRRVRMIESKPRIASVKEVAESCIAAAPS